MSCDGCCQDCGAGAPCPACSVAVRGVTPAVLRELVAEMRAGGVGAVRVVTPAVLRELVAEMRAGGVGVLRVGSLEIDLTRAPASAPVTIPAPPGDDDERTPEGVLYRAGAGKRQRLPFGGRS